jgi:hypothetical protein
MYMEPVRLNGLVAVLLQLILGPLLTWAKLLPGNYKTQTVHLPFPSVSRTHTKTTLGTSYQLKLLKSLALLSPLMPSAQAAANCAAPNKEVYEKAASETMGSIRGLVCSNAMVAIHHHRSPVILVQ